MFAIAAKNNALKSEFKHIQVEPISGALGATVRGIDVNNLTDEAMQEIRQAALDHLVIFIEEQNLTSAQMEQFSLLWGELGDDPFVKMDEGQKVIHVVKEAEEKTGYVFGQKWHSDWSFLSKPPAFTLLYGHDIPPFGGDTYWTNMYLAYEQLSPAMQQLVNPLKGVHTAGRAYGPQMKFFADLVENMDIITDDSAMATTQHPLVRTHPETGRQALYVSPAYTQSIEGLSMSESDAILSFLCQHAIDTVFTCRYRWKKGTITIWDNRCTQHLPVADYHGFRREMLRTTVEGETPFSNI